MVTLDIGEKHRFDSDIFTSQFPEKCEFSKCSSLCCEMGAVITVKERDKILKLKDELKPLMRPNCRDEKKWFSVPDIDDLSRGENKPMSKRELAKLTGTNAKGTHCVFFNPQFGCAIQKLSMDKGEHKWKNKPVTCILYPLYETSDRIIGPDNDLNDSLWCSKTCNHKRSVFDSCGEEIEFVAGKRAYDKLKKLRHKYAGEGKGAMKEMPITLKRSKAKGRKGKG